MTSSRSIDFTGQVFGKLKVIKKQEYKNKYNHTLWLCACECGNYIDKPASQFNAGLAKSCCCCINKTHGMSCSRIYRIWFDMKRRCRDASRTAYVNYEGRGIGYEDSWESFENFYRDMCESYTDEMTLERIDVNSNYTKENCMWIPKSEQAKNKRKYKNNAIGVANISVIKKGGKRSDAIKARIQDTETGRRHVKTFSIAKYTKEVAIEKAIEWLEQKRIEFGYKPSHGSL